MLMICYAIACRIAKKKVDEVFLFTLLMFDAIVFAMLVIPVTAALLLGG
jgi:hypothetical protein